MLNDENANDANNDKKTDGLAREYNVSDEVFLTWDDKDLDCYTIWEKHMERADGTAIPIIFTPNILDYFLKYRQLHQRPNILPGEPVQNRDIKAVRIEELARDIRDGVWKYNNSDTIGFLASGYLFDGQTRCMAFLKEGTAFKALVFNNCDINSFETKDTGAKPKGLKDWFHSQGKTNSGTLAAAVSIAFRLERAQHNPKKMSPSSFGNSTIRDGREYFLDGNQGIEDSIRLAGRLITARPFECSTSQYVALHYLYSKIDAKKTADIFDAMVKLKSGGKYCVLGTLAKARRQYAKEMGIPLEKAQGEPTMFMTIRAINTFFLTKGNKGSANSFCYIETPHHPHPRVGILCKQRSKR